MRFIAFVSVVSSLVLAGCGSGESPSDADGGGDRLDAAPVDGSAPPRDAAGEDGGGTAVDAAGTTDAASPSDAASTADASADAATSPCAAMDVREGTPCGPTERPALRFRWDGSSCVEAAWCRCLGADCEELFGSEIACRRAYAACGSGGPCTSDDECAAGTEWCEGGRCVACDNGGLTCRIACREGWSVYERNGCHPCECAPINDCAADSECRDGSRCYAGAFCWDWCPAGDPSCCFGNVCSSSGCPDPSPAGCVARGCPRGQVCETAGSCEPSGCACDLDGTWACTDDCGGGVCITP